LPDFYKKCSNILKKTIQSRNMLFQATLLLRMENSCDSILSRPAPLLTSKSSKLFDVIQVWTFTKTKSYTDKYHTLYDYCVEQTKIPKSIEQKNHWIAIAYLFLASRWPWPITLSIKFSLSWARSHKFGTFPPIIKRRNVQKPWHEFHHIYNFMI
jgi:hypothetical protein